MVFECVNGVWPVIVVDVACYPFISESGLHLHFALLGLNLSNYKIIFKSYLSKEVVQLVFEVGLEIEIIRSQLQKQHKSI